MLRPGRLPRRHKGVVAIDSSSNSGDNVWPHFIALLQDMQAMRFEDREIWDRKFLYRHDRLREILLSGNETESEMANEIQHGIAIQHLRMTATVAGPVALGV